MRPHDRSTAKLYSGWDMKRVFKTVLAGLAMFLVAFLAFSAALRLSIHGREVAVPNLAGKSDSEAAAAAKDLGLNLSVENRFYSAAVTPNHVLSQSPAAGSRVRRGWQVRVTESLGGQRMAVPDVMGQGERPASLVLKRQQLELGTVVHLPAPGVAGVVLGQSPPPNSAGLNGPRVALLVSDGESAGDVSAAYVMPQIVGMTLGAAGARLATVGLRITSASAPQPVAAVPAETEGAEAVQAGGASEAAVPVVPVVPVPVSTSTVITSQSPAPGHRVSRADAIRVMLSQ